MATITDGELVLVVPGASEADMIRGLTAARAYLAVAGVKVADAHAASLRPEHIEHSGRGAMTDEDGALYEAWYEARRAAYNASGCKGLPYETLLTTLEEHSESERRLAELRAEFPDAEDMPASDPGPHFTMKRDFLFAA